MYVNSLRSDIWFLFFKTRYKLIFTYFNLDLILRVYEREYSGPRTFDHLHQRFGDPHSLLVSYLSLDLFLLEVCCMWILGFKVLFTFVVYGSFFQFSFFLTDLLAEGVNFGYNISLLLKFY